MLYEVDVLDHGKVALIEVMGDDSSIVDAARVSYGKGTKKSSSDRALIRYLLRHRHTTPFEMVEFKFYCKMPIFVARQWIRHRTANVNEYSARYSILDNEFYIPEKEQIAEQSRSNNQGRDEIFPKEEAEQIRLDIDEHSSHAYNLYRVLLNDEDDIIYDDKKSKLARELSRMVIPTNIYTQWIWKIDLHNMFHFLGLRMDPHAQWEMRQYANEMAKMVKKVVPIAYEAFEDYRLNAIQFTAPEIKALHMIIWGDKFNIKIPEQILLAAEESGITNKREKQEFLTKLLKIVGE